MAKTPVSQEEIQLRKRARRRLVGAIALVLIAIVILPMVLDGEPRQRPENINIQIPPIPPQASAPGAAPVAPAAPPEHPAATPPAPAAPTPAEPMPAATPATPEPAAAVPAPVPPTPAPAEPRAVAAGPSESFVIQIGCFSDTAKSRALASQIKANKIPAFSEPAGREHPCTRVRAGPFPSQDAAHSARERLLKLKLIPPPSEGKIVRRGD